MKYIKKIEKISNKKIEIGDYVKFKPISSFYDRNKNDIFKIVLSDFLDGHIFFTLYSETRDFKLGFIPFYTVRHITDKEKK